MLVAGPGAAADTKAANAPDAAAVTARKSAPSAERAAVRDAIWQLERSLRERLAAVEHGGARMAADRVASAGGNDTHGRLDALRREAQRLGAASAELGRKTAALRPLVYEVERRESADRSVVPSASAWKVHEPTTHLDAAATATCGEAVAGGDGRFGAAIGVGTGAARELWLRHTAAAAGTFLVSTAGSDFDTVVEVYDSCPTAGTAPIAHGDDQVGLQARAAFRAAAGETSWIRVAGWEGATGAAAIEVAGGLAGFGGVVIREDNGQPATYRDVEVWAADGSFVTYAEPEYDGVYVVFGLTPGSYFASTQRWYYQSDGLLDELYSNFPCPGGALQGCNPTSGTPISVQAGVIRGDIDFVLGHGASVTGRVRDAATGLALANSYVEVFGPTGGSIGESTTDAAGRYIVTGLGGGMVFARANGNQAQYRRELYHDIPCAYSCNVTTGTPIALQVGQTTSGIDFALEKYGAIAGTLTRAANGLPIANGQVEIWNAQGNNVGYAYANAAGEYVAGGLDSGTYFAVAYSYGMLAELYDDLPCATSCIPTTGDPIAVSLGNVTADVDFALQQLGSIAGTVSDAVSGTPIAGYSYISLYTAGGSYAASGSTYGGVYQVTGLLAGTYYVHAESYTYRGELYDDVPCPGGPGWGCTLASGTPITVQIDATTAGIDLALTPLGTIAGTITDAANGQPLNGIEVLVWNGGQWVAGAYTSNGSYQVKGLDAGTYYVTTRHFEYAGELYDNLPCPGGTPPGCNPTSGAPLQVTLGTTTSGIDFALARKGHISGVVRDASNNAPIGSVQLSIYDAAGNQVRWMYSANDGSYEATGLEPGTHYVKAYASGYEGALYDGLPCPLGTCNPTTGTAVPVTLGNTTSGIDFDLVRAGKITGTVLSQGGEPLPSTYVNLYDAAGNYRGYDYTDADGRYEITAEQGTWFVLAEGGSYHVTQLYSAIPCPGWSCTVTNGTPVPVAAGATTSGIDFQLVVARGILGCVTDNVGNPLRGVAIDLWSNTGVRLFSTVTGVGGCYHLLPDGGTYFVSTDSGLGAVEELWNNVPCPLGPAYAGLCNPLAGTPVTLPSYTSLVNGIDFVLDGVDIFVSGFESGDDGWSASSP